MWVLDGGRIVLHLLMRNAKEFGAAIGMQTRTASSGGSPGEKDFST